MSPDKNKGNLKTFFIKLIAIAFAAILIINISIKHKRKDAIKVPYILVQSLLV